MIQWKVSYHNLNEVEMRKYNNHYDMEEQCVDNSMVISHMFVMYPNTKDYFVISMIRRSFKCNLYTSAVEVSYIVRF